ATVRRARQHRTPADRPRDKREPRPDPSTSAPHAARPVRRDRRTPARCPPPPQPAVDRRRLTTSRPCPDTRHPQRRRVESSGPPDSLAPLEPLEPLKPLEPLENLSNLEPLEPLEPLALLEP